MRARDARVTRVRLPAILTRLFVVLALLGMAVAPAADAQAPAKIPVRLASDLPQFTYPIAGSASDLLQADPATFAPFAAKVGSDIDSVLAKYDIQDHATLRALLGTKLELQVLAGDQDAAAAQTIVQLRALEDKPDQKLISGVRTQAILDARHDTGASSGPAYAAAFQRRYHDALAALPWSLVGNDIKQSKELFEVDSPGLVIGDVKGSLDPAVAKTHALSNDSAGEVIGLRFVLDVLLPLVPQALAALDPIIAQNTVAKPSIWPAREVTLTAKDRTTPVRVAIWDSGSDVTLFPGRVFTDPHPNGMQPHGFAYDVLSLPSHGYLYPLTPVQRAIVAANMQYVAGFADLDESIDSPAATSLRKKLATLPAAQASKFLENVELTSQYAHGTHVAGIAMRGNGAARLVVGRITYDYHTIPIPPSEELERRGAAVDMAAVRYFHAHHVRVVNMSWGESLDDNIVALEKNGIGKNAAERKQLAEKLFAIDRDGLYAALKSAPDVLFVCAAGNEDNNATFAQDIPSGFVLPNLLVVGAVDQAGDETSFTTYGKTVTVDADGYEVLSFVPGGQRLRMSGTSMASPNVANLAAKLLALDPHLTPRQTIALIQAGATKSHDGRRHLIDPKHSVALLKQMKVASF